MKTSSFHILWLLHKATVWNPFLFGSYRGFNLFFKVKFVTFITTWQKFTSSSSGFWFFPVMIFFPFSKFSFVLICSCYPLYPISSFSIWIGSPAANLYVTKIFTCFLCFLPESKPAKSGILRRFRLFCC